MARKICIEVKDFIDDAGHVVLTPIGTVHSPIKEKSEKLPFQSFASDVEGTIELKREFEPGLDGVEGFSHLFIVFYMHKNRNVKLRTVPLLEEDERGIFGTRSPSRPNHIGVSTVRLLSRDGRFLKVKGLDIFDGTPILDIKPYVPKVDLVQGVDNEWLVKKLDKIDSMDEEQKGRIQRNLQGD
ncbi:MAG TPA: tRNA (N6-threonylcarbamoyladenosine(37)-N6)-methyltransferase TrmO [Thermoplasmata archaeon]|nr:tRNA (N6-threonylcarbamoyladenosine(37)-N6)-methyltransferase TrmO [Thermoplasmata archaeon]